MAVKAFTKGTSVRCPALFTNANAAPADPTTVTFKYRKPGDPAAGTTLTYGVDAAVVKDSTGNYHVDLDADTEGVWSARWEGTGALKAALEYGFRVIATEF